MLINLDFTLVAGPRPFASDMLLLHRITMSITSRRCETHLVPCCGNHWCLCAGIKESVNMSHIKMHYYTSHPKLNYYAVVPKGLEGTDNQWWQEPHNRDSHLGSVDV